MATRTVTGRISTPTGSPWAGFTVEFRLTPTAWTLDEAYPEATVSTVTIADGSFAATLATGVQYTVSYPDIFVRNGSSTQYPRDSSFAVVVPDGVGAITLGALQAAANVPAAPPSVLTLIDAAVDPVAASLTALTDEVNDISSVQLGRVHLVISRNEAFTWGLLLIDLDGTSSDLTNYACTFSIWANGAAGGTPVIVLTEGAGVTIGAGTLAEGTYNVLIEIGVATVTALPNIGLGTYALVGDNGVDWPRTLATYTVEVTG